MAVIRWDHSTGRREASASRKLGVVFWWYQGRGIQVLPAGCCARYQHQVMACSQSDGAAGRSGPWRFQDCGFSPPRSCLTSRKQTSMDQRPAFARAAQGEQVRGPYGTERLQQALIGWDIQAHRTLAASPTAANLLLASRTQAGIATAAGAILHAGARTGHVDTDAYEHRLAPTVDATQVAWTHVASRWAEMTSPADRTDLDLVHAAGELRAALREVAHDKTTWASPDVMAGRVDLGEAAQHLQQALSTAVDVACVIRDVAAQDTNLTGPARAMSHRANADTDRAADGVHPDEDVVWV